MTHWGQGHLWTPTLGSWGSTASSKPGSKEAKAVTGGKGVKRSNEVAEAPVKKREVTAPGCCSVNLGHSRSHQVIKGHRDNIHHTLSEDISGQIQSQDSSGLAELRKECHSLIKKKTNPNKQNTKTPPQKSSSLVQVSKSHHLCPDWTLGWSRHLWPWQQP